MKYQGRITDWNDERGFGFITPNGGGTRVFLHISAFSPNQRRPRGNELVTYQVVRDERKRECAAKVTYVESNRASAPHGSWGFPRRLVFLGFVMAAGYFAWQYFGTGYRESSSETLSESPPYVREVPQFTCEGKTRCFEMTSCEEAKFYLRNCPGVKIDGDMDGVPCEDQLCGH